MWAMSRSCGSRLDGGGDALIAAAATDIAAHRAVDLGLGGLLVLCQERGGLHDLAGLAITALRDIRAAPGLLHRVIAVWIEPLDRCHGAAGDITDRGDAGEGGSSIHMYGAGAALGGAAAKLGAGKPQLVTQIPEKRHRRIAVERLFLAVDAQLNHASPPLKAIASAPQ